MKFFQENGMGTPLSDEEAFLLARRLHYQYVPKGEAIRMALDASNRFFYIMAGKAVCSFPQESEFEARAYRLGIDLAPAAFMGNQIGLAR
mgnify:FL=1